MLRPYPAGGDDTLHPPLPTPPPLASADLSGEPDAALRGTLRRRFLSPHTLISFAVAAAIIWFALRRLNLDLGAIASQIQRANPALLAAAFALWYGSFLLRGWRWGRMLEAAQLGKAAGHDLPPVRGLAEIVLIAFFANALVPAKLGDAYRGYLLKRQSGVPWSAGFGSILAERLIDAMMLVIVLAASAVVVFGGALPSEASPTLGLGAGMLLAGVAILVTMWFTRDALLRLLPARVQAPYSRLQGAVFGSLRRPGLVLGVALLLWLGDGLRVWFVASALGAGLQPSVAILVAVMGALLTIIPFTPAGLGVVELGIASILVGVLGVDPVLAGSIVVLDRVVAYWSLLLVGGAFYLRRTRRELLAGEREAEHPVSS